jgi:hypothetical protein
VSQEALSLDHVRQILSRLAFDSKVEEVSLTPYLRSVSSDEGPFYRSTQQALTHYDRFTSLPVKQPTTKVGAFGMAWPLEFTCLKASLKVSSFRGLFVLLPACFIAANRLSLPSVPIYPTLVCLLSLAGVRQCGVCPVFDQCAPGGIISPETCVYLPQWWAEDGAEVMEQDGAGAAGGGAEERRGKAPAADVEDLYAEDSN